MFNTKSQFKAYILSPIIRKFIALQVRKDKPYVLPLPRWSGLNEMSTLHLAAEGAVISIQQDKDVEVAREVINTYLELRNEALPYLMEE